MFDHGVSGISLTMCARSRVSGSSSRTILSTNVTDRQVIAAP